MGIDIQKGEFTQSDYQQFQQALLSNLEEFSTLLKQPNFGRAASSSLAIGAELEMYIVDVNGQPLCINQDILDNAQDPQLTLELNKYNLEYNLTPYAITQQAFAATELEILQQLRKLSDIAASYQGRVIPIGILPTLQPSHFGLGMMTDRQRYHTLVRELSKRRQGDFKIDINGLNPLQMAMPDVTLEGANTSFQIHYRINPDEYANLFNAFQLVTPLLVALAANSPGIFGHDLWHETRIPLFKQSIDSRIKDHYRWNEPARVNFGHGWVRQSALELFQETVNIYPPLLPICSEEFLSARKTKIPKLAELRLHQSTVWLWNRPVYDDADNGHLRIEMRSLPAGPTPVDMVANAAFYIGLAESFKNEIHQLIPALPFHLAEYNFYRAAQWGLDAKIIWPDPQQSGCRQMAIIDVLHDCLPRARAALKALAVSDDEIDKYLGIIEQRIAKRQTGATWQKAFVKQAKQTMSSEQAQSRLLEQYIVNSRSNQPVSEWEL